MAQPPPYNPVTSFITYQAQQAWFPGQQLDVEFNDITASIAAIRANLALIQKDDGTLGNGVVGWDQLSPAFQVALRAQGFTGAPSSGPNTWLGTQSFLGSNTAAITGDGAQVVVQNSSIKQSDLFAGTTGGVVYDGLRSVVYIPPGSTPILSGNAFGAYVRNRSASGSSVGAGVLFYGLATATGNNTNVWGMNTRVVDSEDATGHGYTGIRLVGEELDIVAYNTGTTIQGSSVNITGSVQPLFAAGYAVAGNAAAQFTFGFVSQEGSILSSGAAFYVGALVAGATNVRNTGSQGIWWNYYDSGSPTGAPQAWKMAVNTSGDLALSTTEGAGKHLVLTAILQTSSGIFSGTANPLLLAQSTGTNPAYINIDNVAGGQQAGLQFYDAGAKQWQIIKQTDNSLLIFDVLSNHTIFAAVANGGAVSLTPQSVLNLNPNGHGVSIGGASDPGSTNLAAAGAIFAGATASLGFTGLSLIKAPSDGILELLNNAGTGFTRLQFGGTTASFPAIKRNATALNFRLADDSADAAITAAAGTFSGPVTTPAGTTAAAGFNLPAGSAPTSPSDGNMWQDGTNVKIRIGATTKTFTIT